MIPAVRAVRHVTPTMQHSCMRTFSASPASRAWGLQLQVQHFTLRFCQTPAAAVQPISVTRNQLQGVTKNRMLPIARAQIADFVYDYQPSLPGCGTRVNSLTRGYSLNKRHGNYAVYKGERSGFPRVCVDTEREAADVAAARYTWLTGQDAPPLYWMNGQPARRMYDTTLSVGGWLLKNTESLAASFDRRSAFGFDAAFTADAVTGSFDLEAIASASEMNKWYDDHALEFLKSQGATREGSSNHKSARQMHAQWFK